MPNFIQGILLGIVLGILLSMVVVVLRQKLRAPSTSNLRPEPTDRRDAMRLLRMYYLQNLVEDCIDGSTFDRAVLTSIEQLEKRFRDKVHVPVFPLGVPDANDLIRYSVEDKTFETLVTSRIFFKEYMICVLELANGFSIDYEGGEFYLNDPIRIKIDAPYVIPL